MLLDLPYHDQDVQLPHPLQDACVENGLGKAVYTSPQVQKRLSFSDSLKSYVGILEVFEVTIW